MEQVSRVSIEINLCYGDALKVYNHKLEDQLVEYCGTHVDCNGTMSILDIGNYKALICKRCFLRIEIGKDVKTYNDLAEYLNESEN